MITNDKYCVYAHINKINGKIYIGQTCQSLNRRWRDGEGYKSCTLFYRAIEKYGWDNFDHEIIASNLTLDEANRFEELLIDKLDTMNPKTGYNLRSGGNNGIFSEEVIQKRIGVYSGENSAWYGKHHTNETKMKMSKAQMGKIFSVDHKRKISENHADVKGKKHPRARKVAQYDKQGNLIRVWDYAKEAMKELGISNSSISECCHGKLKSAGGFIWRYAEDISIEDIAV